MNGGAAGRIERSPTASPLKSGLEAPFFIMGCQGSGNNLVALILSRHSRIAVYLGTHYYPLFAPDRHRYGDLRKSSNLRRLIRDLRETSQARGAGAPEVGEILQTCTAPTFEAVLAAFLHLYARRQGKPRVGERTSQHYLYLREIQEGFPESPVVFTIRDPRDTAFALRGGLGTGSRGSIRAWNAAYESYSHAQRPVHLVRYEDLVQRPADTVAGICSFLGEMYEPAMLRFFEHTPQHFRALPHHRRLFQPLDARSVGVFRQMAAEEIEAIEASCAGGMEAVGYVVTTRPEARKALAPTQRKWFLALLIDRLRYYRWSPQRWRLGLLRWKIVLRVRARYVLRLGFVRKDWHPPPPVPGEDPPNAG